MRSNLVLLRASRIASYERRHGDCGRLCALSPFFFSHSYRGTAHSITDWLIAGPVGHKNLRSRALNQHGTEIPSVSGREGEDRADHNCSKSSFKAGYVTGAYLRLLN